MPGVVCCPPMCVVPKGQSLESPPRVREHTERDHASGSGTTLPSHVAKARLGDLGPGRGGIRRVSVDAKTVVTQRRVGGIQSSRADIRWRQPPVPLPVCRSGWLSPPLQVRSSSHKRYVPGPLTVPGEVKRKLSAEPWTPQVRIRKHTPRLNAGQLSQATAPPGDRCSYSSPAPEAASSQRWELPPGPLRLSPAPWKGPCCCCVATTAAGTLPAPSPVPPFCCMGAGRDGRPPTKPISRLVLSCTEYASNSWTSPAQLVESSGVS